MTKLAPIPPAPEISNRGAHATGRGAALLITVLYGVVVAYIAWHHELWRDEVRALNIAAGARSLADLFALLHNEGHPPLWYLLLYAGYRLTHSMLILKPISLACAVGASFVFVRRAPFPTWQKVLFLGGGFPLYEYSVICRNYGISMLLMFVVAMLYKNRFVRPWPLCGALFLLANTNAYSLVIVGAVLLAVFAEALVTRVSMDQKGRLSAGAAALVVVAGMSAAAVVMLPDSTSTVSAIHTRSAGDVLAALVRAVVTPGSLCNVLTGGSELLSNLLFWGVALYLVGRRWICLIWTVAAVAFSTFSQLVYGADLFQRGLLYVLLIALLWIDRDSGERAQLPAWLVSKWPTVVWLQNATLTVLLLAQVLLGLGLAWTDLHAAISSSESLGRYLNGTPSLRDAVVISEPDVMVEALPYYAPNRIFLPREGKDLVKVSFTTASKSKLSLDEFLDTAERLRTESGKPVVMVVHHPLSPEGPFAINYPYAMEFDYSVESLQRFMSRTRLLSVFDKAVSDENYALFELR
jgi:hypothetical protein